MRNLCLVLVLLLSPALAAERSLPQSFTGTYTWEGDPQEYRVSLDVDSVSREGDTLRFEGRLSYQPGNFVASVRGKVGPDGVFTMSEFDPNRDMVVSGSHQGRATSGLDRIEATWVPEEKSGRKGKLELQAGS